MKVSKKQEGKTTILEVEGRLDTLTAPDLQKELNQIIPSAEELVLDFTHLEYISSAGLRTLLAANREMSGKGGMKIVHASDIVREVFDVTGFSEIMNIE